MVILKTLTANIAPLILLARDVMVVAWAETLSSTMRTARYITVVGTVFNGLERFERFILDSTEREDAPASGTANAPAARLGSRARRASGSRRPLAWL